MTKKSAASGKKSAAKKTTGVSKKAKDKSDEIAPQAEGGAKSSVKSKMDAKTKNEFRAMLFRLRERISGQIMALKCDSLSRDDVVDLAEDGTDAFERQLALTLVSSEHDSIFEIDEALQRIEDGIYGLCERCSKNIDPSRLKALPFVKMCVSCKSATEKGKPKFHVSQQARGL